jgi:protein-disulfide isomerase
MKRTLVLITILFAVSACTPKYVDPNPPRATKGSPFAAVTVEEYGDFQCPACGRAAAYIKQSNLHEKYGERVQWKYFHFPLISIHPFAFNAAMAAECANDQGKFWEYHDTLFADQDKLRKSDLDTHAQELGLDTELFGACFKSRAKSETIRGDITQGERKGVQSTPTFFLNGELVSDWTRLETLIDTLLSKIESDDEEADSDDEGSTE